MTNALNPAKFGDPWVTADGSERAWVELTRLETLWFNTGTLCNITCRHCFMGSSPANDLLAQLTAGDVGGYLDEAAELTLGTREVGFTGGEPFLNPEMPTMLEEALRRGLDVLVLTNAMRPMMRPAVRTALRGLQEAYPRKLALRVSLDHYTRRSHEEERGGHSWSAALRGLRWLVSNGFRLSVAGRTCWGESDEESRSGYARLFTAEGLDLDAHDSAQLVLFPELDAALDVPEITVSCWESLGVDRSTLMCATGRMVVRRRQAASPTVVACTLLPFDSRFEWDGSLGDALGPVPLNHPYCARFCVLGGGTCSRSPSRP